MSSKGAEIARSRDPDRRRKYLEKERAKWKNDRETGKKGVNELSEREKRAKRKTWRGDGSQNHDDEQNQDNDEQAIYELALALLQQRNYIALDRLFRRFEIDQLLGLVDQLPQQEEAVDVPVGGIEINPPQEIPQQIERRLYNNGAEVHELNPAEQEEDPIIDEMRWWREDDGSESDTESVPDSDSDDDGDNGQDAPVHPGHCYCPPAQYQVVRGGDQGRRRMKKKMGELEKCLNTEF